MVTTNCKAVTITGYQLDGKDNENYTIKTTVTAYGTITPAPLKLDQATAESRAYVKGDKSVEIDTVTFEGWKDSKVAVIGTDYTATGMMADDKVGDNKDVTVTVELKGDAAKNYRLENATTTTKVTITQADYKGTKETTGIAKFGTEGTVDLSALIVEGGKLGEVKAEDTNSVLDGELSMDGKTLKFKFKADAKKDQNAKVTVKVTSDNYKEYTITVTLKVTEKLVQAPLKYAGRKTVTYGDTLQLNVTGGSGEGAVTYTASFNGKLPTAVENGLLTTTTGTGVFLVRVDKAGDDTHEGTFVTFEITVTKAPLKIEVANKQIYVGEAVPDLKNPKEGTDYTVTGLVKPEDLKGNAVLKYQKDGKEVTKPDTSKPGVYALQLSLPETKETVSVSVEIPGVFRDVSADDWFFNAVYDAYGRGLMVGESSDLFAPNDSMTRAMLITTLYRMSGSPAVTGENPYSDVPAGSYYEKAVIWAMQKGVANGMGGGKFEPDTRVTRQQAVTMLYRYAVKIAGIRTDERAELGRFTDSAKINAYAITAMRWAVGSGLMKGYPDNTLQPNGTLTRAEAATLLVWLAAKI